MTKNTSVSSTISSTLDCSVRKHRRGKTKKRNKHRKTTSTKRSVRKAMKGPEDRIRTQWSRRRVKKLKRTRASFQRALDIERYRLNDQSTKLNTKGLKHIAKQVDKVNIVLGPKGFNQFDPITLLFSFVSFRMAFNNAAVH